MPLFSIYQIFRLGGGPIISHKSRDKILYLELVTHRDGFISTISREHHWNQMINEILLSQITRTHAQSHVCAVHRCAQIFDSEKRISTRSFAPLNFGPNNVKSLIVRSLSHSQWKVHRKVGHTDHTYYIHAQNIQDIHTQDIQDIHTQDDTGHTYSQWKVYRKEGHILLFYFSKVGRHNMPFQYFSKVGCISCISISLRVGRILLFLFLQSWMHLAFLF